MISNSQKKFQLLKAILAFLLLVIIAGFSVYTIYVYHFNHLKRHYNYGDKKNSDFTVEIGPRTGKTDSWTKLVDENGTEVVFYGTTYDAEIINTGKHSISKWTFMLDTPKDCYLNNGWNGTFEVHQNFDGKDIVQNVKLSKYKAEHLKIKYRIEGQDLLIPLKKKDYIIYYPDYAFNEYPIEANSTGKNSDVTFGMIFYTTDGKPVRFNNYSIDYRLSWSYTSHWIFHILILSCFIWAVLFVTVILRERKINETILEATARREYETIGLINTHNLNFIFMSREQNYDLVKCRNFPKKLHENLKVVLCHDDEEAFALFRLNWETIINEIKTQPEYYICYNAITSAGEFERRKIRFSYIDKKQKRILFTVRTITDLYNAELAKEKALVDALELAKKANQAKSEFLSQISHDIRTPLNGITGMLQLAKLDETMDEVHSDIDQAATSAEFLLGLINDILDMSKIEAGKVELHPEPYNYEKFKQYLDVVIKPMCIKRNLEFTIESTNPEIVVLVDVLRFNQIFFNLLSNAAKYTLPGGHITFRSDNYIISGGNVTVDFYVRDNGIGMSEDFQKHIFETFTQEQRSIMQGTEGTGLGLAIVYNLVKLMGGKIKVKSEINKGTEFKVTLTLPITDAKSIKTHTENESKNIKSKLKGANILLCEDNLTNQRIASRLLERTGIKVTVCSNGKEGYDTFKASEEGTFDMVLMDIRMPIMDGITATRKIRLLERHDAQTVPIIAMTANALNEERDECLAAGMIDRITKPIDTKVMYHTIANHLIKRT